MEKKLSWEEITKLYNKEWVELIEYDWPDEESKPLFGVVRTHADTKEKFDQLISNLPPIDCALVYVGASEKPPDGIIPSANFSRRIITNA